MYLEERNNMLNTHLKDLHLGACHLKNLHLGAWHSIHISNRGWHQRSHPHSVWGFDHW